MLVIMLSCGGVSGGVPFQACWPSRSVNFDWTKPLLCLYDAPLANSAKK